MQQETHGARRDFFISYNHGDAQWATWIAHTLEAEQYTTVLQAWDFRPGSNFVLEMQQAAERSDRTIIVLSPNFLGSQFTPPEWANALARDPQGLERRLVPVLVEQCGIPGLLRQIVYIDLVDCDETEAVQRLLAGVQPGRNKPVARPTFPGAPVREPTQLTPAREVLRWRPVQQPLDGLSRDLVFQAQAFSSATQLDVSLLPAEALRVEARRLTALQEELPAVGRQAGLFRQADGVETRLSSDFVAAWTRSDRERDVAGILISATGQRTIWHTLPHDSMGAVFDPEDLRPRLEALLQALVRLPVEKAQEYGVALRLRPITSLSIGPVSTLGSRTSMSMPFAMRDEIAVDALDCLRSDALEVCLSDVAEELTARLQAALRI